MQTPDLKAVAQKWVDQVNSFPEFAEDLRRHELLTHSDINRLQQASAILLHCISDLGFLVRKGTDGIWILLDPQEEQGGQGE